MRFALSLDTELGVGPGKTLSVALHERKMIIKFLDLFEKYEAPVTWAIVGHLFLSECSQHDLPYNNCAKPNWKKVLYAPDLIEKIQDSSIKHEIACHSFAHINYAKEPLQVIEEDIKMALVAMKNFNVYPKTFIFPWNAFNTESLALVKKYGFNFTRTSFDFKDYTKPLISVPFFVELNEFTPMNYIHRLVDVLRKDAHAILHVWTHPSNWRSTHKLEEVLIKIKKEEVPVICIKDGYDFNLPVKNFVYASVSTKRITYIRKGIGIRIYYANLTNDDMVVEAGLVSRSMKMLMKMPMKPKFHSPYHAERVKIKDGKLLLLKRSVGEGVLYYKIPRFLPLRPFIRLTSYIGSKKFEG